MGAVTTACAYDRAGYGGSDPTPPHLSRTSQQLVAEVRGALQAAAVAPPYVLVGHSFGAINMIWYALHHPTEVAGLVLVEPSHPEMFERAPSVPSGKSMARGMRLLATLNRWQVLQPFAPWLTRALFPQSKQYAPALCTALTYMVAQGKNYPAAQREAEASAQSFRSVVCATGTLGALPLVVLTAESWRKGKPTALKRTMPTLHEELAQLSSRGEQRIITGCDHNDLSIMRADAVVEAVRQVLAG